MVRYQRRWAGGRDGVLAMLHAILIFPALFYCITTIDGCVLNVVKKGLSAEETHGVKATGHDQKPL